MGSIAPAALLAACAFACSPAAKPSAKASPGASTSADLSRPLPSPVPEIVARVNGEPIHLAQIVPVAQKELRRPSIGDSDQHRALALRRALRQYVERELLLQEALSRGVAADDRAVQWSYDQQRRDYADDVAWTNYLAGDGLDPQSFRAELRVQQTIATLVAQEAQARGLTPEEARTALLDVLRKRARIELFL
jgi:hypothetical protein